VDLRSTGHLPGIWDQLSIGSCTAHGTAAAYSYDLAKQGAEKNFTPARLFLYYNARLLENTVGSDSGATITDAVKGINQYGCPPEADWVYNISQYTTKPPTVAYTDGATRQSVKYARVPQTVVDMQACLTGGFPIVIGFTVYESFESQQVAGTGVVPMPGPGEQVVGGHCTLLIGYAPDGTWILRNSWGVDWGQQGYFTMPQQYLTNPKLASDFWFVSQVESPDPTPIPPSPSPTPVPDAVDAALIAGMDPWADSKSIWSKITKAGRARDSYHLWKLGRHYN
jgi:C1A family cysteine protease